eukprot:6143949-Pleurochrysis_carterae.AAC.2
MSGSVKRESVLGRAGHFGGLGALGNLSIWGDGFGMDYDDDDDAPVLVVSACRLPFPAGIPPLWLRSCLARHSV